MWEFKFVKVEILCIVIVKVVCGLLFDEFVVNFYVVGMFCIVVYFLLELVVVKNIWFFVCKFVKLICYCFLVDKIGVILGLLI